MADGGRQVLGDHSAQTAAWCVPSPSRRLRALTPRRCFIFEPHVAPPTGSVRFYEPVGARETPQRAFPPSLRVPFDRCIVRDRVCCPPPCAPHSWSLVTGSTRAELNRNPPDGVSVGLFEDDDIYKVRASHRAPLHCCSARFASLSPLIPRLPRGATCPMI